jgi:O-antigen ligase
MKKLVYIGLSVLLVGLYLIHSYNSHKGHSFVFEPIYISIRSELPQNTRLDLQYTTINDPVTPRKATLLSNDTIDKDRYIFKIDSSYRIKGFRIFFLSLQEDERFIISEIKAFNSNGGEFNFRLNSEDLVSTENLKLDDFNDGKAGIKKVASKSTPTPSLFFDMRGSFKTLFTSSDLRAPELPSLFAAVIILLLLIMMALVLYPLRTNIAFKGVSPGAYLLAFAIVIMPSGEKLTNLIIIISIISGLITSLNGKSLKCRLLDNKLLLYLTLVSSVIYIISFLLSIQESNSRSIFILKLGFPMILLSIIINVQKKEEIRLQYVALIAGVIISAFIHFGWIIIFADSIYLKNKLILNPRYYLESSIFSRVHHSYLSVLYLAGLTITLIKQDITILRVKDRIIFSSIICITILLAYSRAAVLSLMLILLFFAVKKLSDLLNFEITRLIRYSTSIIITAVLLTFIFSDFRVGPTLENNQVSGLQTRINIWENAAEIIKQKPITGWGIDGYRIALIERNNININYSNYGMNLSTHNQFLATSGMFGILMGVGLIWFLIFPTGFSKRCSNSIFIFSTSIIFITSFLFESFLNRNLGILIFGLVYGLLMKKNSFTFMEQKKQLK